MPRKALVTGITGQGGSYGSELLIETGYEVPVVNVGVGDDVSIGALVEIIARVIDFEGTVQYDASKPDATPRKFMDSTRFPGLGWSPCLRLERGVAIAHQDFKERFAK
jgi:GDP-L-fucose synthase